MLHTRYLIMLAALGALGRPARAQNVIDLYEARTFTAGDGHTLPYRLFKPSSYNPKQKYPLTIFLHGSGESGTDNLKPLRASSCIAAALSGDVVQKSYPSFVVIPQCPRGAQWGNYRGDAWPAKAAMLLIRSLMAEFNVDKDRVYVTGLSLGGMGTWYLIENSPEFFAAAVPQSGGGNPMNAPKLKKLPIWAFHGDADTAVPLYGPIFSGASVVGTGDMLKAVGTQGGRAKLTVYAKAGHNIWCENGRAYQDPQLWPWLFAQKRMGTPSPNSTIP